MEGVKITMEPLNEKNYHSWSIKMKGYLIIKDVWKGVVGRSSGEQGGRGAGAGAGYPSRGGPSAWDAKRPTGHKGSVEAA